MALTIPTLTELPPSMAQRARWARHIILTEPHRAEIDEDELLAWVYHDEDEVWYSIAGNYSRSSPSDKQAKRKQYQDRAIESQRAAEERFIEQQYWSKVRYRVLLRDKNTCQMCLAQETTKLHIHHILKRIEGGTDHEDNLITVCPKCHRSADTNLYNPEWRMPVG